MVQQTTLKTPGPKVALALLRQDLDYLERTLDEQTPDDLQHPSISTYGRHRSLMSPSTPTDRRPLRADARQNAEQILQVAQDVFADLGYQASIAEVARRSGLGMGPSTRTSRIDTDSGMNLGTPYPRDQSNAAHATCIDVMRCHL